LRRYTTSNAKSSIRSAERVYLSKPMNRNDLSIIVSVVSALVSALVSVLVTVLVAAFGALAGLVVAAYVVGMASGVLVYAFWRRLRTPSGRSHDTPRSDTGL